MTVTARTGPPLGTLLKVSVTGGERRLDLGVPGSVPVVELTPALARSLNLLTAELVHGGYDLVDASGRLLDPDRSLQAQGVEDGALLTLEAVGRATPPKVYDDVVEAVADAVEDSSAPWTARDSARMAVAGSVAFLLCGAVLLAGAGLDRALTAALAAGGALLVLAAAAVAARVAGQVGAACALVLTAACYAGLAGWTLRGSGTSVWEAGAASTGLGVALAGALGLVALPALREVCLVPLASGGVVAAAGLLVAVGGLDPVPVLSVTLAAVVTLSNALPWLAMSSTPLHVVTPQSDAEIVAMPPPIDPGAVGPQYRRGHRTLLALRAAVGVVALTIGPAVVAQGWAGATLAALGYAGMLLSIRQAYARPDVLVVTGIGIVGLVETGLAAAVSHPDWRTGLAVGAAGAAAAVVGLAVLAPRPRAWLGRLADTVDVFCLALLLPLGVIAAGIA